MSISTAPSGPRADVVAAASGHGVATDEGGVEDRLPSPCCRDRSVDPSRPVSGRVGDLTDVELLGTFSAGRSAPLFEAELFRRIRRHAAPELRSIVGATPDEDDLSQEVVTKVWVNLDRFDPAQASFRTWVSRIAGNTGRDYLRRVSARPKSSPVIEESGCMNRHVWEVDISDRSIGRPTEEANVLAIVVDNYCDTCKSGAEAKAVRAVLADGYRIADVKAMDPSIAGKIDGWVKKARQALQAEVATEVR